MTGTSPLRRFDPAPHEPVLRIIDPVPPLPTPGSGTVPIRPVRIILFGLFLAVPEVLLAVAPNTTLGGTFWGRAGLCRDLDFLTGVTTLFLLLFLLVNARRSHGGLLLELEGRWGPLDIRSEAVGQGRRGVLRILEWATRLTPVRSAAFLLCLVLLFTLGFERDFARGDHWRLVRAEPGSPLHFLSEAGRQPNLAGIWHWFVFSAVTGYLWIVAARLYVVFATVCEDLARAPELKVTAFHPDRTGGLLPVGRAALTFAFFSFIAGLSLTLMGLARASDAGFYGNLDAPFLALFGCYVVLAPPLFVLPLLPFRPSMTAAKRRYLDDAEAVYEKLAGEHERELAAGATSTTTTESLTALSDLMERAEHMAVWPLNGTTVRRFIGTVLSPFLLVVINRIPEFVSAVQGFLEGG